MAIEQEASFQSVFLTILNGISYKKSRALENIVKLVGKQYLKDTETPSSDISQQDRSETHVDFRSLLCWIAPSSLIHKAGIEGLDDKGSPLLHFSSIGRQQCWGNKRFFKKQQAASSPFWGHFIATHGQCIYEKTTLHWWKYMHTSLLFERVCFGWF